MPPTAASAGGIAQLGDFLFGEVLAPRLILSGNLVHCSHCSLRGADRAPDRLAELPPKTLRQWLDCTQRLYHIAPRKAVGTDHLTRAATTIYRHRRAG